MRRRALLGLVLAAVGLAVSGCARSVPPAPPAPPGGGWTDERGEAVLWKSFLGAPVVVSAFFTSCTVRCPLTVSKLKEVDLAFQRSGAVVPIVLLTLDPRTDTPERLSRFREERGLPAHWRLLRGSPADTYALARRLRVDPAYDTGHIDHEVRIAVFDGAGRLAHSFSDWSFDASAAVIR
jgi:protein SCO1/2